MKRRSFLTMIGAAVTAPLLPRVPLARVAKAAPYSAAALHGAIIHAQSRVSISSWSLAQTLGVPVEQANSLMVDLADRGVLGHMRGSVGGSRWASSRIFKPVFAPRPASPAKNRTWQQTSQHATQPDLSLLMAHLRDISARYFAAQAA
ncbi:hypothetical protein [Yoonia sp. 208BN28-4]|uniref:hypothetical protein n=1 Tax=Yoonia sp. 208BN28-4 TaxID=3126505 RepID=UPI0030A095D0